MFRTTVILLCLIFLSSNALAEMALGDLGLENPGILPTNPFYFLKEWGRGIRRLFTFNPVARAELELRIANEKAAELKRVSELNPNRPEAIQRAIDNYNESATRLRARFESLREISENPNVDRLLNQLEERTSLHQQLFQELEAKHEVLRQRIENAAPPSVSTPVVTEIRLEADDRGFYPDSTLRVKKDARVRLTFVVRTANVYFGGLDFRSDKFKTDSVKPGGIVTVEFTADESFSFSSYWPLSDRLKATGQIRVE